MVSSKNGQLYSAHVSFNKETSLDPVKQLKELKFHKFQNNPHTSYIQALLKTGTDSLLSVGFDRLFTHIELQMDGRFTEQLSKFHTLGETPKLMQIVQSTVYLI